MKLWELLKKIWHFAYWPFDWRGGQLQELFKKGARMECDNHRGLLINDHMGKAASVILSDDIDARYHGYLPQSP